MRISWLVFDSVEVSTVAQRNTSLYSDAETSRPARITDGGELYNVSDFAKASSLVGSKPLAKLEPLIVINSFVLAARFW